MPNFVPDTPRCAEGKNGQIFKALLEHLTRFDALQDLPHVAVTVTDKAYICFQGLAIELLGLGYLASTDCEGQHYVLAVLQCQLDGTGHERAGIHRAIEQAFLPLEGRGE